MGQLGALSLRSLLPRPELLSWGPAVQGPRGSCSTLDSGHSLHMASPGGLLFHRLTHPGHGLGTLLAFGLASEARQVVIVHVPGSPTRGLLGPCAPSHVCDDHTSVMHAAQWAVQPLSLLVWGLSCCRAAWGGLCVCAAHGGEQFQGAHGGQDVCDPLFHLLFEQKLLEGQSPNQSGCRGPGATTRVTAWWPDPCVPGLWGLCPSRSTASLAPCSGVRGHSAFGSLSEMMHGFQLWVEDQEQ